MNPILGLGELANFADLDLSKVDTNYPVLESGIYPFTIQKLSVDETKKDARPGVKGQMLVLEVVTDIPVRDKNGKEVPAGFKLTHRIGLSPTFKEVNGVPDLEQPARTADQILRDVCTLLDAVFGEEGRKAINLATFDMNSLVNQKFTGRTSIDPEKDGYQEQTRISRFVKKEGAVPALPTTIQ